VPAVDDNYLKNRLYSHISKREREHNYRVLKKKSNRAGQSMDAGLPPPPPLLLRDIHTGRRKRIGWLIIQVSRGKLATTGWQRLIGCLKLQVIFRKRATNYRALLRKMTCEAKASYDSTPPCNGHAVASC